VGFFDEGVRPDRLHQLLFFHQASVTLDQRDQQVEDFGLKWDRLPIAPQEAVGDVQSVRAEFINPLSSMAHDHSKRGSGSATRISHENSMRNRKTWPRRWPYRAPP